MQILLGKGWWQKPTGSSWCFPGVICRGTRRNRVPIVIHFRVCGAERGRETGFPFLSALEVFRGSQVPLLHLNTLWARWKQYTFSPTFPLRPSLAWWGSHSLVSVKDPVSCIFPPPRSGSGMRRRGRCHIVPSSQQKPEGTWGGVPERSACNHGATAALLVAHTRVTLRRTIHQTRHKVSGWGVHVPGTAGGTVEELAHDPAFSRGLFGPGNDHLVEPGDNDVLLQTLKRRC